MEPLPLPETYAIFLDTNAIFSTKEVVPRLPDSVENVADLHYLVPQLVIEERAQQLLDEFFELKQKCSNFTRFGVEFTSSIEPTIEYFRNLVKNRLKKSVLHSHIEILEPIPHLPAVQVALFEARHNGEYKDVILFDIAASVAQERGYAKCIFITKDKRIPELARYLRIDSLFEFQSLSDLTDRLQFNQSKYRTIKNYLLPLLQKKAISSRCEFAERGRIDESLFAYINPESLAYFRSDEFDFESIDVRAFDLSLRMLNREKVGAVPRGQNPTDVICGFTVRFEMHRWARVYLAKAKASLNWENENLVKGEIHDFEINWVPFG